MFFLLWIGNPIISCGNFRTNTERKAVFWSSASVLYAWVIMCVDVRRVLCMLEQMMMIMVVRELFKKSIYIKRDILRERGNVHSRIISISWFERIRRASLLQTKLVLVFWVFKTNRRRKMGEKNGNGNCVHVMEIVIYQLSSTEAQKSYSRTILFLASNWLLLEKWKHKKKKTVTFTLILLRTRRVH